MIVTGSMLGVRKRERRRLQEAHYERPRRVQWDLAQSRVVFLVMCDVGAFEVQP